MINAGFTELLLGALAILLLVAAVVDVRTFTISNRLNLAVAAARAALSGCRLRCRSWPNAAIQLGGRRRRFRIARRRPFTPA